MSTSQYIYQISTNPKNTSATLLLSEEEVVVFDFGDLTIVTGMNDSITKTIDAIKKVH